SAEVGNYLLQFRDGVCAELGELDLGIIGQIADQTSCSAGRRHAPKPSSGRPPIDRKRCRRLYQLLDPVDPQNSKLLEDSIQDPVLTGEGAGMRRSGSTSCHRSTELEHY